MNLEQEICNAITDEAKKLIQRYQDYHNSLHLEHARKKKRMSGVPKKDVKKPDYWACDSKFDPFYVKRKANSIARSIAKKIASRTYKPNKPFLRKVPKKGGGFRTVSIYQIPDAAISRLFYKSLIAKNRHRFSSFSYAYRNDRNVHFAIQDISIDLRNSSRTFIAEFDFSDFFGSISHEYLINQFNENGFLISPDEQHVIKAFLESSGKGVPQGTSISLFLANMVCWDLDKKLERSGVRFARYADDTVIWSPNYDKICQAFGNIDDFSRETGVQINAAKSAGISLLTKKGMPAEIASKDLIDFLGYSLSVTDVSIKKASVAKIKKQISYILFKNMIQPLHTKPFRALIIPANNRDQALLTAIVEIRRYLYGGLTSTQILNYIHGKTKRIYFKGVMSYYPLLSDIAQLKAIDGWLVSVIHKAIYVRGKLLNSYGYNRLASFPFNTKRTTLLGACRSQKVGRKRLYEIPSFALIHAALSQALTEKGIEKVMNSRSLDYDY